MHLLENFLPASPSYGVASHIHNCGSGKQRMEVQPLHADRGVLNRNEFYRHFSGVIFQ